MKLISSFLYGIIVNTIIAVATANITVTIEDLGVRAERAANLSHITGVSRKIQIYIKNRFLQILPDGTVNGSNNDISNYTIFQRISVLRGQLKIQAIITCFYLCMNSSGLLYGSRNTKWERYERAKHCLFKTTIVTSPIGRRRIPLSKSEDKCPVTALLKKEQGCSDTKDYVIDKQLRMKRLFPE
ncbi:PREDICTED: fibroblast growth factor 16 [Ceratosolen solmsi marchali]|uniref:Fibroblast growth factor 16 n=1 Tax=Ceratosolen solmsi marchali TaxID=326594 RepID=A0AAJ6YDP9_9HYME|nr:PREDICTED: fibroblast growth factor 16 [Ceratosolen solmsi marchali]